MSKRMTDGALSDAAILGRHDSLPPLKTVEVLDNANAQHIYDVKKALRDCVDELRSIRPLADLGEWLLDQFIDAEMPDYDAFITRAVSLGVLEAYQAEQSCTANGCPCADVGFPVRCYRRPLVEGE